MSSKSKLSSSVYTLKEVQSDINTESSVNQGWAVQSDDRNYLGAQDSQRGEDNDQEETRSGEDLNQSVKKLVRYVLACEYQRLTIKRAGIVEKVIGKQGGNFKKIFEEAQKQLRNKFGMEMIELPARQKVTIREKKAAQKLKGNSKPSPAYILKTILPPEYRNADIMLSSKDWSTSDDVAYIGLYTLIICLISLSADKQLANHQLDRYLKRLNLNVNTGLGTTFELLARMKRENYLQESKIQDVDGETSEWRVGPRGLIEVNKESIIRFVQKMYSLSAQEDISNRLQRSLGTEATQG